MHCPLCHLTDVSLFFEDSHRPYFRCRECGLIFVPPSYRLDVHKEKARYDTHHNNPFDPGYRRFLSRLFGPLCEMVPSGQQGLDFGCGPGPTLSVMLEEAGYSVVLFDRFYANDPSVLQQKYDFITATEVVEHLFDPGRELDRLWECLRPGGVLGMMTKLARDQKAFATWHYIRDLTHVCFFSHPTFAWLARRLSASVRFVGNDVVLFSKE